MALDLVSDCIWEQRLKRLRSCPVLSYMSTPPPTPPVTYPPAPAVATQANVQPVNALAAIVDHFLPSPLAIFWRFVLLDAVVIMSAIAILFTGYCKLQAKNNAATTGTTRPHDFSPLIELTGKRLLVIVLILAPGMFKLVESIMNKTMTVTIVDFISGAMIALIIIFIDYFEHDHPTVAEWFFRRDYSWFVLMALSKMWSICACVLAALLLLPLGTLTGLAATPYINIIGTMLALLLGSITCEAVLLSSMHSFRLSQRPTRVYIFFRLAKRLRNIIFLWGVLWMTLLISVRSNPELEPHLFGIYARISIDKIIA